MPNEFEDVFEGVIRDLYERASTQQAPASRPRSYLEAQDGTYLGKVTANRFDAEGIFNEFGPYGSKFSSTSIFNEFGPYGSKFSATSPWNQFAASPPRIVLLGVPSGVLTKNRFLAGARDPDEFLSEVRSNPLYAW